jgi:hypothetical protein
MPAIQLARLRLQAAHLRDSFSRPEAFARGLQAMMEYYADRTHRSGQSGEPPPLIPAYHAPAPVLRQVLLELKPLIQQNPEAALVLADVLWSQNNLECKLLATSILGNIPVENTNGVLIRITAWSRVEKEDKLLQALLNQGLAGYRRTSPINFLKLVEQWLASDLLNEQKTGLMALAVLIEDPSFTNLPAIFQRLTAPVKAVPAGLRSSLLDVLRGLARRSPTEAAYFLKENLLSPGSLAAAWLIRQLLNEFPKDTRETLRESLRQAGK